MAAAQASTRTEEARFFELDILRGLAAYMVVIFHYKHFLFISDTAGFDYDHMPFSTLLAPVYVYGQFFVELFFSISGYVFFWLYAEALSERRLGLKSFFIARFARLYPLYFITFIIVALTQWAFHGLYGQTYIYHHNTPGQFALNLFMVHQWIPHAALSFNGPSWSISVEVFLYAVFFLLSYARLNTPVMVAAMIAAGLVFKYTVVDPTTDFARGVPSFFLGGLIFYAVRGLRQPGREKLMFKVDKALTWGLPVLWVLTYIRTQPAIWQPLDGSLHAWFAPIGPLADRVVSIEGFIYGLLPLTLLALGLRQGRWGTSVLSAERLNQVAWIGDISYSLYLIHFPLQLGVMILLTHWPYATRTAVLGSPLFFILFMTVATLLARLSFRYFEMPMRNRLKVWLTRRLTLRPADAVS